MRRLGSARRSGHSLPLRVGVAAGEYTVALHDENSHGADCFRYVAMAEPKMTSATLPAGGIRRRGLPMAV